MSTEFYFPSRTSRRWLRVGPLAGDLDRFAIRLKAQGYARPSEVSKFRLVSNLSHWQSLEVGMRHDGGDAETGFGVDIGAGLAWTDPASGMKAKVDARGLLTHEANGFRERGIAGSLARDPAPSRPSVRR